MVQNGVGVDVFVINISNELSYNNGQFPVRALVIPQGFQTPLPSLNPEAANYTLLQSLTMFSATRANRVLESPPFSC